MYIAMNRFKIVKGREPEFENVWKNRETHLAEVPGFKNFNLVKGDSSDDHTLYASHSIWESKEDFWIGQSLKHLDLRIKMLENIEIYILVHLILRALKKYYKNKSL